MQGYNEILTKLKAIKQRGWLTTHRSGPTGIGKTLEDLLGINENNIPGPNGHLLELKSARKNQGSMLTLFTKSPEPGRANALMLEEVGYKSAKGNDKKELHTTVNAVAYNTLKGKQGLKIDVKQDRIELVGGTGGKLVLDDYSGTPSSKMAKTYGYWTNQTLKQSFERKLPRLLYVKADWKGSGANEEFWFNEAELLEGFSFENFAKLLKAGDILVDIRMGQYQDGRPHDHGTAFRVVPDNLNLCFSKRTRVI